MFRKCRMNFIKDKNIMLILRKEVNILLKLQKSIMSLQYSRRRLNVNQLFYPIFSFTDPQQQHLHQQQQQQQQQQLRMPFSRRRCCLCYFSVRLCFVVVSVVSAAALHSQLVIWNPLLLPCKSLSIPLEMTLFYAQRSFLKREKKKDRKR